MYFSFLRLMSSSALAPTSSFSTVTCQVVSVMCGERIGEAAEDDVACLEFGHEGIAAHFAQLKRKHFIRHAL